MAVVGVHRRLWPLHGLLAVLGACILMRGLLDRSPVQLALGAVFGLSFGLIAAVDLAQPRTALSVPVRLGLAVVMTLLVLAGLLLATLG